MTSTNSASDLLKSYASLVFAVLVVTAGDMLVDLLCASASVEPVRLDLERHVPNWFRSGVGSALVLPAVGCALLPAVGYALLGSFHHFTPSRR